MDDRKTINIPGQPRKYVERRKKQDWVVRSVSVIAVIGWILAFIALLFLDRASPLQENFITRFLSVNVVSFWNTSLLRSAFAAILASFIACVVGFVLNASRHRRKSDRFNKLLIAIGVASTVMLVLYLINFSRYL